MALLACEPLALNADVRRRHHGHDRRCRRGERLWRPERFLDRQVDALRTLLAEAEVEAEVGLRSLVDQQPQPGAAAGGEAVEEVLVILPDW